ncbi:MAG: GPR endopeptidase, partial [Firmicutes bacterium]|nr:GPR endopeptidase [Bacillota bacterium]
MTCSPERRDGYIPGYNIRTDLALEANEVIREGTAAELPGVKEEVKDEDGIKVTKVTVLTDEASSQLGKPIGKYVTIESPELKKKSASLQNRISRILAREITEMAGFQEKPGMSILVIGLGNWNVTPDALGPKVVEDLLVTRHIFNGQDPFGLAGKGFRRVAALS